LHTITHVGLHVALVVGPRDAELIYAIRDAEAFDEVDLVELGVLVVLFFDGAEHLFDCLMILRFTGETALQVFQD
jgi:hypothetical protein